MQHLRRVAPPSGIFVLHIAMAYLYQALGKMPLFPALEEKVVRTLVCLRGTYNLIFFKKPGTLSQTFRQAEQQLRVVVDFYFLLNILGIHFTCLQG